MEMTPSSAPEAATLSQPKQRSQHVERIQKFYVWRTLLVKTFKTNLQRYTVKLCQVTVHISSHVMLGACQAANTGSRV